MFSSLSISIALPIWAALASATNIGGKDIPSTTYNASAATTNLPNTDYSNERLAFLWNQVGPVSTHPTITSLQEPTPEPEFAKPGLFHPLVASNYGNLTDVQLPENFAWGLCISAYQSEGAVKDGGRGPAVWDLLSHRVPNWVADNSTGDVVGLHYYLYKQDFARLKAFGIPWFSPSISWPRLFPFGRGPVNQEALDHYDEYIGTMVKLGIKPAISIFHWDTPLALFNEYNAWTSPKIVDDYVNYAKFVISRYDEYVPIWYTINEPQYCFWQFSEYPAGDYWPSYGVGRGTRSRFLCGHYTLLAHAKVAKWYHEEFKGKGRISFKSSGNYFMANSSSAADAEAVQRSFDFVLGWFNDPVWNTGDYPQSLKDTLGDLLPEFTEEEKKLVKGSCDFFALDGYSAFYAAKLEDEAECIKNRSHPVFPECAATSSLAPDGFGVGPASDYGSSWLKSTPTSIRLFLNNITKDLFPSVNDIVISEFGFSEPFESSYTNLADVLWDLRRADYLQGVLDNILLAIHEDKINVTGAFTWSIYDNFEWNAGTQTRFGIQYLDYVTLKRTPKASLFQLVDWYKRHGGNFI